MTELGKGGCLNSSERCILAKFFGYSRDLWRPKTTAPLIESSFFEDVLHVGDLDHRLFMCCRVSQVCEHLVI